jgi:replicative DNA helicase
MSEERKESVDELFKKLRQKALKGELETILDIVEEYSYEVCDRMDEVIEVMTLGVIIKMLKEITKEREERKKTGGFQAVFDNIKRVIDKIEREKKRKRKVPRVRIIPQVEISYDEEEGDEH